LGQIRPQGVCGEADVSLQGAVLAVVASDDARAELRAAPLRSAGAVVRCAVVNASGLATLSAPGFDAAVLDVADDPEPFEALVTALGEDERTRGLPLVALPSTTLTCGRLASLGLLHVVAPSDDATLTATVAEVVARGRMGRDTAEYARAVEDRLRTALERLATVRTDVQAVAHDARVLCNIVIGFAANLRDGIAGPIGTLQLEHVTQILQAANDTAAILDRLGAQALTHSDSPPKIGSAPPAARRTNRRAMVELAELSRSIVPLFANIAEQKSIGVQLDASEPLSLWCDAMQVKQIVTNLLSNALKFTPAGGRVTLSVRSAAPTSATSGPAARRHAELVVSDTGPGIPVEERERVFERGVRLARDQPLPGSGIGLAVVREMAALHGGTAHADATPGGGAAVVVRLPFDMRARRDDGGRP
jgi:signal transduction histidine kinase